MQKIKTISLTNFKFFVGDIHSHPQNKINIDRKNLLLYGENGSGKSTIYWALYTFLQSCLKVNDDHIFKYFRHNEDENLRNRFIEDTAPSGIEVHFEDEKRVQEIREITDRNINTKQGTFVTKTLNSSDFINYKYLSKVYDFRNSEPIDLFLLFEKELFPFIELDSEYTLHDGSLSGTRNASDWWKFIIDAPNVLPYNNNIVSVSSQEYIRFKWTTIPKFIELLKKFLLEITQSTNEYLEREFKEDYSINFNTDSIEADYNKNVSTRAKDGILHFPKIPLKVSFNHPQLNTNKREVSKPHTFLNEARLTAIALAIRLAILDRRPKLPDSSRILVLDDLLLSLDMSHRNTVLDIILKKSTDFQLFILTHDKLFFELAKHKSKKYDSENWKFLEMYSCEKNGIPQPLIFESETYLGNAEKFLNEKRYEIAGNFLRKEAEDFCKRFLPNRLKLGEFGQLKPLAILLQEANHYASQNGIDINLIQELDNYRKFLLNDSSHDSFDVPKFKSEIESCISVLKSLNKIQFQSILTQGDKLEFELTTNQNCPPEKAGTYKFEIIIQDDFRLIKEDSKDSVLSKGMINYTIYKNGVPLPAKKGEAYNHGIESLKKMYEDKYSESDSTKPLDFWDGIILTNSQQPLRSIKAF